MSNRTVTPSVQLTAAQTLEGYDRWAPGYDEHVNPLVAATGWLLEQALPPWAGADVVELGCGTGRNAAAVLAAGARSYLGVDGSEGMLAQARHRVADGRAAFCLADLHRRLPLPDGCCDQLLIVLVLEHIAAPGQLFAEVARLLRPGGELRLLEIHPELLGAGRNAHFELEGTEVRFTSQLHPVAALLDALTAAGLAVAAERSVSAETLASIVPRLARHVGRDVVLDLVARKRYTGTR